MFGEALRGGTERIQGFALPLLRPDLAAAEIELRGAGQFVGVRPHGHGSETARRFQTASEPRALAGGSSPPPLSALGRRRG